MNVIPEDNGYKPDAKNSHFSSNSSCGLDDEMDEFEEIKLGEVNQNNPPLSRKKGMIFNSDRHRFFDERSLEDSDCVITRKASKISDRGFYDDRDFDKSLNELDDDLALNEVHSRKSSNFRKISDIGFYSDMDEEEYRMRKMSYALSVDEGFRSQKHSLVSEPIEAFRGRTPSLVDELLCEIYTRFGDIGSRRSVEDDSSISRHSESHSTESDAGTEYSTTSSANAKWSSTNLDDKQILMDFNKKMDSKTLLNRYKGKTLLELRQEVKRMDMQIKYTMSQLTRQVKRRDRLRHRRERQYNLVTAILQASSQKRSQDTKIRFSLDPSPGDPGYNQWKDAMKMVARLPEGIPIDFRKKLWLTLAEKHLSQRNVEWKKAERFCFNEWSNPDDDELGIQIVKDLHRTGCSLFCGDEAEVHQLMLKRVLLAYARWNKAIGYCQGFNMLGAIILEVMDKSETDALKVMIYMIEGVLPEFYFTNNLRGLSVDMAVFRDLLKLRLPKLSKHLDVLQQQAREGTSYEPPLTNVFTMQWFLTLFSTCLPRFTVLRVWDLILLEGNEVLLRTALAIWQGLEEQILPVTSADEFYSLMGQLSSEMLLMGQDDSNNLIKNLVDISPFPFTEVDELREKYTYNITPWSHGIAVAKRGLKILYSDDEDALDEDDEKIAVAATFGISAVFGQKKLGASPLRSALNGSQLAITSKGPSGQNVDKDRLSVDISALRKQYSKLRQRQKQAHIILTSAWSKQTPNAESDENQGSMSTRDSCPQINQPPLVMNHLLLGKKPLVGSKPRKGPPPGAVPAPRSPLTSSSSMQKKSSKPTKCTRPQPEITEPKVPAGKDVTSLTTNTNREEIPSESEASFEESETATTTTHVASLLDSDDERGGYESISTESTSEFVHKLLENFDKSEVELEQPPKESLFETEKAAQMIKENSDILDQILRQKSSEYTESSGQRRDVTKQSPNSDAPRHFSVDFSASVKTNNDSALMRRAHSLGGEKSQNPSLPKPFNPFPNRNWKNTRNVGIKLGLYK